MMDFITVPVVVGIIVLGIYKLFELFVCKKERLTIIEKLGDKLSPEMVERNLKLSTVSIGNISFSALKFGFLFIGLGIGLLLAFTIHYNFQDFCGNSYQLKSCLYGASVLLFGGLGLLIAFLVELKISRKA